jgi:hypothetical protein
VDLLPYLQVGANLGAVGTVLLLLANGMLVARSWVTMVVDQANRAAAQAQQAAEASDRRADQVVQLMTEQTAALRTVEALVRALADQHRGGPV